MVHAAFYLTVEREKMGTFEEITAAYNEVLAIDPKNKSFRYP